MFTLSGRGNISTDVEKEVLTFTETKLAEEDVELNSQEKNFSVLVEILGECGKIQSGKNYPVVRV